MKSVARVLVGVALFAAVFGLIGSPKARAACLSWWQSPLGQQCLIWAPDPPAGAHYCSGTLPANGVRVFSGTNYTGYCIELLANIYGGPGADLSNATNDHWYQPYPIASIQVGAGSYMQGYMYSGADCTGAGWYLGPSQSIADTTAYSIHSVIAR